MTKNELMGPSAAGFWRKVLNKDDRPKREYIALTDAAVRLGCTVDHLLDKGENGKLDLYAPVLYEDQYVWPVSESGIPFSSLGGSLDCVDPLFRTRLPYGRSAMLVPADIKKIRIERAMKPQGYICPELVLQHISDWQKEQRPTEQVAKMAERLKLRAKKIAWVLADLPIFHASDVKTEMLRLDISDFLRLREQYAQPLTVATTITSAPLKGTAKQQSNNEIAADQAPRDCGLMKIERQIHALEAAADALNFDRKLIPHGGKKAIFNWCLENNSDLFKSTSSTNPYSKLDDVWKKASRDDRIIVAGRDRYANGRK